MTNDQLIAAHAKIKEHKKYVHGQLEKANGTNDGSSIAYASALLVIHAIQETIEAALKAAPTSPNVGNIGDIRSL